MLQCCKLLHGVDIWTRLLGRKPNFSSTLTLDHAGTKKFLSMYNVQCLLWKQYCVCMWVYIVWGSQGTCGAWPQLTLAFPESCFLNCGACCLMRWWLSTCRTHLCNCLLFGWFCSPSNSSRTIRSGINAAHVCEWAHVGGGLESSG